MEMIFVKCHEISFSKRNANDIISAKMNHEFSDNTIVISSKETEENWAA